MNTSLITWCIIAALSAVTVIARIAVSIRHHSQNSSTRRFLKLGQEWEEIYIPGDRILKGEYDYDEFDEL